MIVKIAFFVSSAGDSNLAKAVIAKLIKQSTDPVLVIPLTQTGIDCTKDLKEDKAISVVSIDEIVKETSLLAKNQISEEHAGIVKLFLETNQIEHAYVGVPSNNSEIPYQIANQLTIPFTVAYEYMFKPDKHSLWKYIPQLAANMGCHIAVPLESAVADIKALYRETTVDVIGHLSLDSVQTKIADVTETRETLSVDAKQELIFVSGTSQPTEVDNQFLDVLLAELSTGQYPSLQLRMGLHPGVKDLETYLQILLATAAKYPTIKNQFKIILDENKLTQAIKSSLVRQGENSTEKELAKEIEDRLKPFLESPFIIRANVSGPSAAKAADKITQAVPGALLNEAALQGKPSYFHERTVKPYLPVAWFSQTVSAFFAAKPQSSHTKEELGLTDSAPNSLLALLLKKS